MFEKAGTTTLLQLTIDGAWENALALRPGNDARRFLAWAGEGGGELAIEAFSCIEGDDDCFIGARFDKTPPRTTRALVDFVARFSRGDLPFERAIGMLGEIAGGALFRGELQFLELGMFNNWKPFGPLRFWNRGNAEGGSAALDAALAATPRYLEPTKLPIALEIAFANPLLHWAGFIVSRQEGDRWRLDVEAARNRADIGTRRAKC